MMLPVNTAQIDPSFLHRLLAMSLSDWWEKITKRFLDYIMEDARTNNYFSYKEYAEMQETYKEIYGEYYAAYKPAGK